MHTDYTAFSVLHVRPYTEYDETLRAPTTAVGRGAPRPPPPRRERKLGWWGESSRKSRRRRERASEPEKPAPVRAHAAGDTSERACVWLELPGFLGSSGRVFVIFVSTTDLRGFFRTVSTDPSEFPTKLFVDERISSNKLYEVVKCLSPLSSCTTRGHGAKKLQIHSLQCYMTPPQGSHFLAYPQIYYYSP